MCIRDRQGMVVRKNHEPNRHCRSRRGAWRLPARRVRWRRRLRSSSPLHRLAKAVLTGWGGLGLTTLRAEE
eukprot:10939759-Alexandrium_andersonii.AAC.1